MYGEAGHSVRSHKPEGDAYIGRGNDDRLRSAIRLVRVRRGTQPPGHKDLRPNPKHISYTPDCGEHRVIEHMRLNHNVVLFTRFAAVSMQIRVADGESSIRLAGVCATTSQSAALNYRGLVR